MTIATHRLAACAAALTAALLGSGCTSTRIENAWQTPDLPSGGYRSVGVIGIARRPEMRAYHERNFVERLDAAGIRAVASADGLPDVAHLGRDEVQAWARRVGVETVLTTRLVDIQKETWSAPLDDDRYWVSPGPGAPEVEAAYVTYRLETRLYEVSTARLLFVARTESVRPVSPHSVVLSVIDKLIHELTSRGLLVAGSA